MTASRLLLLAMVFATAPWAVADQAASGAGDRLAPVRVADLHYGDTLFHFFQDHYFEAIVRAEAYRAQGRLVPHADDAELLLGGLYLSFGQHTRAAGIFERLLAREGTPQGVRDRAWFHLGKVMYARSYFAESERALRNAGGSLPPGLEAERRLLLAQGLMYRGEYQAAAAELAGWDGPPEWRAYAQFNLGVAFFRAGLTEQGLGLLDAAGQVEADREEVKALRDKANVALGYAYLQSGKPGAARAVLERVRLSGPQSNKALLGAGWADAAEERYADALLPWQELHGRGLLDAAVQESYLALPYAYARLDANRQAAEYYEQAVEAYDAESRRLGESIRAIEGGRMLAAVLAADQEGRQGWFWQLAELPDAPESRYLYHLLAGNEFQEALKHYRALDFAEKNLAAWTASLGAFEDMVATRDRAFAERLPMATERIAAVDVESLDARRDALQARLDAAVRDADPATLASADEQRLLAMLDGVDAELAARGDDPALAEARDKARLARGVLTWRLEESFKVRAWQARRELRELDSVLFDARTQFRSVEEAMAAMPARNAAYAERIAELKPRLADLDRRVAAMRERQGRYLADLAIGELRGQQARLREYSVQARYALATLYDRASMAAQESAPVTGATP